MRRPFVILCLALLLLSLVRLVIASQTDLIPDEAYYWSWSLHPDWCYWDQPAGIAWATYFWTGLFGNSVVALRGLAVLCSALASFFGFLLLRKVLDEFSALWGVLVLQIVPLFAAGSVLLVHDTLLLLFAVVAWWALVNAAQNDRPRWWLVVGLAMTGALYAKFSAALLGMGFAAAAAWHPVTRRHLRTPWPYLGALLAAILFAPVILWNAKHQWVAYYAVTKLAKNFSLAGAQRLVSLLDYAGGQLLVVSPLLAALGLWATVDAVRRRRDPREQARMLLVVPAAVLLVYFLFNSLQAKIQANWPAIAWVALVPLGVDLALRQRRRGLLAAAIALSAVMTVMIHAQVYRPIVPLRPDITDQFHDWQRLAQHVQNLRREYGQPALMTRRYQIAAELLYHLPDRPDVYTADFAHRGSQFTIWEDFGKLIGRDALFIDQQAFPGKLRKHFAVITELPSFVRQRDGREVERLHVYLARNFRWDGPSEDYLADPVGFQIARMLRKRAARVQ